MPLELEPLAESRRFLGELRFELTLVDAGLFDDQPQQQLKKFRYEI